jgi:translation elongation factor EF-G
MCPAAAPADDQNPADVLAIHNVEVVFRQAASTTDLDLMMSLFADDVIVPTTYTSTVIQQLTGKRGQILGMNPSDRSGLGTYSWRHERYDPVPGNRVASKAAV